MAAQTTDLMSINYPTGNYSYFNMDSIQAVCFSGAQGKDTLHVQLKNGIVYPYALSQVKDITFSNIQPADSIRLKLKDGTVKTMAISSLSSLSFIDDNITASVLHTSAEPHIFSLEQNYPNPFNPTTTIRYDLPSSDQVSLTVINVLGQVIGTLVHEHQCAGSHQVTWNASAVPSGIYFYRLETRGFSAAKAMFLVK